ncbi:hypothetical protein IFR05_013143 [Cadophora sp. M221]|nr:hypothetical protein IFR05_013143 [Cadophora sp. M221]
MTFDRANGTPTQASHVTHSVTSVQTGYSSPPMSMNKAPKINRVPVGGRSGNASMAAFTGKEHIRPAVSEIFSSPHLSQAYTLVTKNDSVDMYDVEIEAAENRDDSSYRVTKTPLGGHLGNLFSRSNMLRIVKSPHIVQKAGSWQASEEKFRHQDSLQRVHEGPSDDRYINPVDGRVMELIVQCTDRVTLIMNPKVVVPDTGGRFLFIIKWPITCFVLNHVIGIPYFAVPGIILNNGCYDPFPYRYWGYCKVTRNAVEETAKSSPSSTPGSKGGVEGYRILEPMYFCFVGTEEYGRPRLVADWKSDPANQRHQYKCPEYLFIAYTTEHFSHSSLPDIKALYSIATNATRAAGLTAYWVGASCLGGEDIEENVFRISDIVRGAHSLVIAISHGVNTWDQGISTQIMLQQWGQRLWTLPEALLATPHRKITVYQRGHQEPLKLTKKQLAAFAWTDSATTRQLIDHYEGNLTLSRLELVIVAMQSLFARKTTQYLQGDHAYVLMGLLRLRPKIDKTDSSFQAFARLSLANDSDMLLERLMCILPQNPNQHWSSVSDAYKVNVWDIYPTCQIAGVCDNNTILVDGAFGATVHWDKFRKVANARRVRSWKRLATQVILHGAPYFFPLGMIVFSYAWDLRSLMKFIGALLDGGNIFSSDSVEKAIRFIDVVRHWAIFSGAIGLILVATSCFVFISSPYLTRLLYEGSSAWLFGFEGYADLETIESQIFGSKMHRLRWSTYGSSLSRHSKNAFNESVGIDPTLDPVIRDKVEAAISNDRPDAMRVFTLVDTNTMTMTLFEAVKPPVAVLLCGSEGGMQRAVACSYEWTTGVCYRENVLRMETTVLDKMSVSVGFVLG